MLYLFLTLILLIAQFLAPPVHAQDALQLKEYACLAFSPQTFKDCLKEVRDTGAPLIKITKPIICESRQDCSFAISDSGRSFQISPSSPENKFIRRNDFGYSLLTIDGSANLTLRDLSFEDVGQTPCPSGTTCPPLIIIKNSSSILLDKLNFSGTRGASLLLSDPKNISITGSTFKNSFKTGLEVKAQGVTEGLRIENNTFQDNSGTGLIFQARSADSAQGLITSNKFINNHSKGAYDNCTYPCIGSQLKVSGPTTNLRLSDNIVTGGVNTLFDSLGLYSSGIEVGGTNINNTLLFCNEISGNRGSGVVQAGPFSNISALVISENKIWGNGLNLNIPTATADENNCYTSECKLSCLSK